MRARQLIALPLAAVACLIPSRAEAFSTRIHIMIANAVREAMIAADDGSIPLMGGDASVLLPTQDFEAVRDYPLAFRAGAVGPDNMVFPGMTDPSHALGQRPYDQCELLYQAAVNGEERAYALGCFLHGATDAVAHHYVNYMAGETFTLTPITADREQNLSNVVRHILAESAIQNAAWELDPDAFSTGKMLHTIPVGFVLRTYLSEDSDLWQLMASHANAKFQAAKAEDPDASLPDLLAGLDVAAADHLVLSPLYLAEVDDVISEQQASLEADIANMQDWGSPEGGQLLVSPGPDGELGTEDDETDCTLTCATLYATYFTYTGLLRPREDAMGNPLPSAFEKISEELRAELFAFHPAYLETVGNLSAKLNEPLTGVDPGFGVTKAEVAIYFEPMTDWADDITTIDYDTLVYAVAPDWIISLDTALQVVGLDVDISGIISAIFQPLIAPIKDAIEQQFIAAAEAQIGQIIDLYEASKDAVNAEYDGRLAAASPEGLDGDVLDHFYDSGLFIHAFNITAATLANHGAVLPVGGVGPASFDASYTPTWMQAGVCEYLAGDVFPLGLDVAGALSVSIDGVEYPAVMSEDSPVECHAGSLSSFADGPDIAACMLVELAALLNQPMGSLSRAYPPSLSATPAECEGIEIPGLPSPPEDTGDGGDDGGDNEEGDDDIGSDDAGETGPAANDDGGDGPCSCSAAEEPSPGSGWMALGLLAALGLRRRRRGSGSGSSSSSGASAPKLGAGAPLLLCLGLGLGLGATACGDDGETTSEDEIGDTSDDGESDTEGETSGTSDTGTTETSTETETTTDSTGGGELLGLLDGTVWHGEQTREGTDRAYELRFDTDSLLWSEIRNPFGPARLREMRSFTYDGDQTLSSTVISPQGWPIHPENGRSDDWALELVETSPRTLVVTRNGDTIEEFEEGPWPAPEDGLTAVVRTFEVGGVVDQAFCDSGLNGFEYKALFDFANGNSNEIVATDVVAGASLQAWTDPTDNNQFSITDVDGFDLYGGTELSDSFNFFVTYTGTIDHPGGSLGLREENDSVEDALWVFIDQDVGSDNVNDLFLEVHGFVWADETSDEPSVNLPGGDVPIQAILVRCTEQIKDVDLQIEFQGGGWTLVGDVASSPEIDTNLFPPAL